MEQIASAVCDRLLLAQLAAAESPSSKAWVWALGGGSGEDGGWQAAADARGQDERGAAEESGGRRDHRGGLGAAPPLQLPTRPLVLSIHGPPGVGKSYAHLLLAQARVLQRRGRLDQKERKQEDWMRWGPLSRLHNSRPGATSGAVRLGFVRRPWQLALCGLPRGLRHRLSVY